MDSPPASGPRRPVRNASASMRRPVLETPSNSVAIASVALKERGAVAIHGRHDQGAVQVVVAALARAFRQKHAPMAGSAQKVPVFFAVVRLVLRAYGVV